LLGELEVLAAHPPAAVLGLLSGHGPNDARRQPAVRGREVVVPSSDHGQADSTALDEIDEGLELLEMEVRLYLKSGSRVISMTTTEDAVLERAAHKTIYSRT
jgi:hypothetical protein